MVVITVDVDQLFKLGGIGIPTGRRYLQHMSYVYSNQSKICCLPKELFNMYWLEEMNFTNLIKDNKFPSRVINLINIVKLSASFCNITDLSPLRYMRKLKILVMNQDEKYKFKNMEELSNITFYGSYFHKCQLAKAMKKNCEIKGYNFYYFNCFN